MIATNIFVNLFAERLHLPDSIASCARDILYSSNGAAGYTLQDDPKGLAAAAIYIALKTQPDLPKITQLGLAGVTQITRKRLRKQISTLVQ
jgi:transcription initiation factor TFIIIB Brf1 subunit/transcription initiation factor TFIIB